MNTADTSGSRIPWREVVLFVALAYGSAWALWFALNPHIGRLFTAAETPEELSARSLVALGMFAPLLAAVLMRLFVSKDGLRGSLGPVRVWRYYGVAVLVPMILVSLTIALDVALAVGDFTWGGKVPLWLEYLALALNGLTLGAFFAFGEEYGWRGYLLPRLLPLGEVKAAVLVGLIWGPWHIPLIVGGLNYPGVNPLLAIAVFIPAAVVMSLLFTRVFVLAGGSVLVVAVLHGSLNSFSDRLMATEHLSGDPLVVSAGGLVGFAVSAVAILIAYSRFSEAGLRIRTRSASKPSAQVPRALAK
jgi:CAAX protease family protein